MNFEPTVYSFNNIYKVVVNFRFSDIHDRFIMYNTKYIESNGIRCWDTIIYDRKLKKLWYDWTYLDFYDYTPKSKNIYYEPREVTWNARYYMKSNLLDSLVAEFGFGGFKTVISSRIDKRKRYNNDEFKDFLEKIYQRESVERDL